MNQFIYVFREEDRDRLISSQKFKLLRDDDAQHVYIFLSEGNIQFDLSDTDYVLSNTLYYSFPGS